ncbi:MAG: metal ABC transporter ATP-binding protein [Bdellovibrionales bacterium]
MTNTLITLKNVSVFYGPHKALSEVSGDFQEGSLTAIAGPNGAGKSTLLKVIAGLIKPQEGTIIHADKIKNKIGYLPQSSTIDKTYPLSVMQLVCTGFWPALGNNRTLLNTHKERAAQVLKWMNLDALQDHQIGELSGGQFQKMLFARLWLQDADVLLLDEPFSGIDANTTARLMELLLDWHQKGKTIFCVLHDLLLIKKYFPESFVLSGKCLGKGHTHKLFEKNLLSFDLDMAEIKAPEDLK